ncbi:MAG: TIGR04283 family arsenosugar biosynthesis glycosyltransferase [Hyphomicrobiaceae bacterium]|uniref:TIGR04283 family arsenosugar biosynthesis glycosyltransferase n=1 Tax=Pseudorhodoplanes sp. TaxID=1934341 RepID=UPI003D1297A9
MISVVIPTLNAEAGLADCLSALVSATVEGLIREVIIVDGGSDDRTLRIADQAGARVITSPPGRGRQLQAGGSAARFGWILFLHADTVLQHGWEREVGAFIERVAVGRRPEAAAVFRLALDDLGVLPRLVEWGAAARSSIMRLPYGDQGLLIPRRLYDRVGGFSDMPLMEDVDLIRRLGRARTVILRATAVTSAVRYKRDGYVPRVARNLTCLTLYYLRVPPRIIARLYG